MKYSILASLTIAACAFAQQPLTITTSDGVSLAADIYGAGPRGVVLAHGGLRTKENWKEQALVLEKAGFHVLAFDFRGFGHSKGPREDGSEPLDVLAAVYYLRSAGAKTVTVIGGSFGGEACADAAATEPGAIDRLIELGAAGGNLPPEKLTLPKLLIVAREDSNGAGPRLPGIRQSFARMPEPKQLLILDGNAHAQFLFGTDQSERVMKEIRRFLSAP
jgi:pimeloyl-ACP methyl ester carboxylesterase